MSEVTIIQSDDFGYFNEMINHPDIYPSIHDDVDVKIPDIAVIAGGGNVFLKIGCNYRPAGFAFFVAKDDLTYEMHSGVTKEFSGRFAISAGEAVIDWIFRNTPAKEIETCVWSNAKNTMWAARKVGFTEVARSPWKNLVAGQSVDLVKYSLQRPAKNALAHNMELVESSH